MFGAKSAALMAVAAGLACRSAASPAVDAGRAGLPVPSEIVSLMKAANGWQLSHMETLEEEHDWERGTWYTGVMAAYQSTGDRAYLDQATRWGQERKWGPGIATEGANVLTCPQAYMEVFFASRDRSYIEPTIKWLDSGRKNTPSGAKYWYFSESRYVDSLYVGAPTLAMLAKATGDPRYLTWMNAFFWDVHRELFDPDIGLFYRDKRFIGQVNPNGKRILWSRGNGWAFASLPRILTYLPAGDPNRAAYVALLKQMAEALAKRQQPDGFWRANLDDPQEFPTPETSGTGFFCYGLAWGIRSGALDRDAYLPSVTRAWRALAASVSPEGKVQWGQNVGDRPEEVKKGDTREYVTGTFLLAGSEMLRLAQGGAGTKGR